jgi:hypothetical protein
MNKQISVKKAIILVVLASVLVGSAVAAVLMTKTIPNTMRMLGAANFKLIREDTFDYETGYYEEVSEIAWGDFSPLGAKNSATILGTRICIYNVGNVGLVFSWNATGLDTVHWSITCMSGASTPWPENSLVWLFGIAAGNVNGYLTFYLTSLDPFSPPQDTGFSLNLYAYPQP